ncbi:hypothetical protein [Methanomassiliicoccus luminyensis]|uniref:hypothetical protein n=2 Tax=Methanomassiliicoccus luminyensis TaxID=1080712 RepID=UPI00037B2F00|nr:hypothetical protein [Methanomassiliicoccus luminyensis]
MGMTVRKVPEGREADAGILAAMLDLVPVRSGGRFELLSRREVERRAEAFRSRGEGGRADALLGSLDFDGDAIFRRTFSQMASMVVRVRTSTLHRMLKSGAGAGEGRDGVMRRALAPAIGRQLDTISGQLGGERSDMLRYSLDQWAGTKSALKEARPLDFLMGGEEPARPALRTALADDRVPEDVRKYSRYFFKNLFRLNNIHGDNAFFYPPEVIENYWEVVAPDQGAFAVELCPSAGSLVISLFNPYRYFGLERTENPDYFGLVEMLALEHRKGQIKGCRANVRGATMEDDLALRELLSIETHLHDEELFSPGMPEELSPAGLAAFRAGLRELSGIRAEVLFPINERSEEGGRDFTTLGFDIELDKSTGRFRLDGEEASDDNQDRLALAIGTKLLALSRRLYRDPPHFPEPDVDELKRHIRGLMERAERGELTEALAREIVAKITVLDYFESLEKYSYALAVRTVEYLEGEQEIAFTIPMVFQALLDLELEGRSLDSVLLDGLGDGA